jgi:hypothetical protein
VDTLLRLRRQPRQDSAFSNCGDRTVSISIDLTAQEIAALRQITKRENDAEAVATAAREFLRPRRLRELKAASGKVEFEANWQDLEDLEPGECGFPR